MRITGNGCEVGDGCDRLGPETLPVASTAVGPAYQCTITATGEPLDDQDFNPRFPPKSGKCAFTHS